MNPCMCGAPLPDTAVLCGACGDGIAARLRKIADRWGELEDALMWRVQVKGEIGKVPDPPADREHGERRLPLATGFTVNDAASWARRLSTDAIWFALQVIREDMDNARKPFTPPVTRPDSQDHTPVLARWIADWHIPHITHRMARETAEEIAADVERAEKAVYSATHPSGVHWVPVNLRCEQHGTSELGERVPCEGSMWALVGRDTMPDLVCDVDPAHLLEPGEWERSGWKSKHRTFDGIAVRTGRRA